MKGRTASHPHHHPKASGGPVPYNAKGSHAEAEAKDKKEKFKRGGAVAVDGTKAKTRLDRAGRKSGGRSPFSNASKLTQAGAHKASEGDAGDD